MTNKPDSDFSPFVLRLLPEASDDELRAAQADYDAYLDVLIRILLRLDAADKQGRLDKSDARASLGEQHDA